VTVKRPRFVLSAIFTTALGDVIFLHPCKGVKKGKCATGHGNRYLARVLGEAAVGAARTDSFLGERHIG